MRRLGRGYTIVEVILVLTISAVLFGATSYIFGSRGGTEFSQTMYAIESKIRSYSSQVSSGSFPEGSGYDCAIVDSHPILTGPIASGSHDNEDCIFLGRAIRPVVNDDKIYIYTILGTRDQASGEPATSFSQANPEIAQTDDGTLVATETYTLPGGNKILSSKLVGDPAEYDLIGIYTNLNGISPLGSQGSVPISVKAYPLSGDTDAAESPDLQTCIEEVGTLGADCSLAKLKDVSQWQLCIENDDNASQNGLLIVNVTPTGFNTQVQYTGCS